eukprot:6155919-Pleurochrysis_carterae.AAC.3
MLSRQVLKLREQLALAERRSESRGQPPLESLQQELLSLRPSASATATVATETGGASASAELEARRRAAGRHPKYRLAFVVPWLGQTFPNWFDHFAASCAASDYLADWIVFHENAQVITQG